MRPLPSSPRLTPAATLVRVAPLLLLPGCFVSSTPHPVRAPEPIPLAVRICETREQYPPTAALLSEMHVFNRLVSDTTAPADLEMTVHTTAKHKSSYLGFGFFLWTLGVIPSVEKDTREVEVRFRPASRAAPCAGSDSASVAVDARGKIVGVTGWAALLLAPLPGLSWDTQDETYGDGTLSDNLPRQAADAIARRVLERREELLLLARRAR